MPISMGETRETTQEDQSRSAAAWAETPAGLELGIIPAEIEVQTTPQPGLLEADARAYLEANPEFYEQVKRWGHDVIAHNRRIITGIGLIAAFGTVGGVVILWRHEQKRRGKR